MFEIMTNIRQFPQQGKGGIKITNGFRYIAARYEHQSHALLPQPLHNIAKVQRVAYLPGGDVWHQLEITALQFVHQRQRGIQALPWRTGNTDMRAVGHTLQLLLNALYGKYFQIESLYA
jgi:hypothetical protein